MLITGDSVTLWFLVVPSLAELRLQTLAKQRYQGTPETRPSPGLLAAIQPPDPRCPRRERGP